MCACRQKKASFLIDDILDKEKVIKENETENDRTRTDDALHTKFNVMTEVQNDLDAVRVRVNLEQRRNTYPLYPMPMKANVRFPLYRIKGYELPQQAASFFSEPVLNSDQILRNQLSVNRFMAPYTVRHPYSFDRGACCNPWWGVGGRRKGGQVRFSAAQTGALERRFGASKYLSPDERRALAASLRLSDRQVKTWFQNRRAKWRRTTSECTDPDSPPSLDEASDDEVQVSEEP